MSLAGETLFAHDYRALVIGAGGAIGQAFVQALQADPRCVCVLALARAAGTGFDLRDECAIAQAAAAAAPQGPWHCIVDATGALTLDGHGPEKSLAALQPDVLASQFAINAIGPLLVLRHFAPLLATGACIYAKLSARVGSISDNRKGGWYGYRGSKAALNMYLQTAAIELQRKNPELRVVALQPGTVRSELSRPFTHGTTPTLSPAESVAGMLEALRNLAPQAGAHFVDYRGQAIPW